MPDNKKKSEEKKKEKALKIKVIQPKVSVYDKVSGLDTTVKGNQEKTNNYRVNSVRTDEYWQEAEKYGIKRPNMENVPKGSVFTMKYQGNTSAFPFKKRGCACGKMKCNC